MHRGLKIGLALTLGGCGWLGEDAATPAAVASAHPLATQAGMQILSSGGNAFDAAVAVTAVLAVVGPHGSGLGGGGFWLLHRASDGLQVMIDGRERAPLAATRDMYLDDTGAPLNGQTAVAGANSCSAELVPDALIVDGFVELAEARGEAEREAQDAHL